MWVFGSRLGELRAGWEVDLLFFVIPSRGNSEGEDEDFVESVFLIRTFTSSPRPSDTTSYYNRWHYCLTCRRSDE